MPIADILFVVDDQGTDALPPAQALADALGDALGSLPGRTWVRLHALPASRYAENRAVVADTDRPVFVTLTLAHPPEGEALQAMVDAVTRAVAAVSQRPPDRVHVEVALAAAGRIAFGGRVVR